MLRALILTGLLSGFLSPLSAAEMSFPYEALVVGEDVVVRSGPGKNYYPTSRLERDHRVTVHRHDPGGWYMITPPPGSISWIESALVERSGNRGVVNVPNDDRGAPGQAVVRIGSTLSDDHGYTGRRLSNGDEVEILGEQTLATAEGPVKMLQIVPPMREYRWVKGDFIVPVDAALRKQADNDPFAIPTNHRGTTAAKIASDLEVPSLPAPARKSDIQLASANADAPSTASTGTAFGSTANIAPPRPSSSLSSSSSAAPASTANHSQRLALMELDRTYADMMTLEIPQWRLGELRAAYQALRAQVDPGMQAKIDVRLAAIAERQPLYDNFVRFAQLTAATEQRDAELLGMVPPSGAQPGMVEQPQAAMMGGQIAAPQMVTPQMTTPQMTSPQMMTPAMMAAQQQGGRMSGMNPWQAQSQAQTSGMAAPQMQQPQFQQPQFAQPRFGQPQFGQPQFQQSPSGVMPAGAAQQAPGLPGVMSAGGFAGQPMMQGQQFQQPMPGQPIQQMSGTAQPGMQGQSIMQAGGAMMAPGMNQGVMPATVQPGQVPGQMVSPMSGQMPMQGAMPGPQGSVVGPNGAALAGAGIVQATNLRGQGVPQYMLTAADGRFLTFLDSGNVNLQGYLGQSLGVTGVRSHDPRLQGDLIRVQSVMPVQLAR